MRSKWRTWETLPQLCEMQGKDTGEERLKERNTEIGASLKALFLFY